MINIQHTLMSQYANSPVIVALITGLNDVIDPSASIESFYDIIWNLNTTSGLGLDIWGRIVGVNRNVQMSDPNAVTFGFNTSPDSQYFTPFNDAPFSGSGSSFQTYRLPDSLYKQLIIIKAASNILYATAPNINKYLYMIFNNRAYYMITGPMTAKYIFEFNMTPFQRLISYTLKLLPNPCGVLVSYEETPVNSTFGFEGTGLQPFDQGTFAP